MTDERQTARMTPELREKLDAIKSAHAEESAGLPNFENDSEFTFSLLQLRAIHEIRQAMEEEGINQSDLADRMGCSRQNVSRMLNEEANFTLEVIAKFAAALNRDIGFQLHRKEEGIAMNQEKRYDSDAESKTASVAEGSSNYDRKEMASVDTEWARKELARIIAFVNKVHIRVTYGAVAEVLGYKSANPVVSMLGKRRTEAAWIVSKERQMPTGYPKDELPPDLQKFDIVIEDGAELKRWMTILGA